MNRLTQKIIKHLLYIKNDDPKFGRFIIGVLFGDQVKRFYEQNRLSNEFEQHRIDFKLFVTNHLIKAETLQLKSENINHPKSGVMALKDSGSDPTPKNINFNYFNKSQNPEETLKEKIEQRQRSNRILKKCGSDSANQFDSQIVSIDNNNSITINIMNKMENASSAHKPTQKNQKFVATRQREARCLDFEHPKLNFKTDMSTRFFELFQNNEFPEDYFDHWVFLQERLRNYQKQLDEFYSYLYRVRKSTSNEPQFSFRTFSGNFYRKTMQNIKTPKMPFFDQQKLGKRNFKNFDSNISQKENKNLDKRDSLFKSMFKPI